MSMPEMIARAASRAADLAAEIDQFDLDGPTTCSEFDQRALANHLTGFLPYSANAARRGPAMQGEQPDFAADPNWAESFAHMASDLAAAWQENGVLEGDVEFGRSTLPAQHVAAITLIELTLHAWDLGRSTGHEFSTDEDIAEAVAHFVSGTPQPNDFFGAPVPVADDASPLARALGASGRDPYQEM